MLYQSEDEEGLSIIKSISNHASPVTKLAFDAFLKQMIENTHMLHLPEHKWNLWVLSSYAGLTSPSSKFPNVIAVVINYETVAGETMLSMPVSAKFGRDYKVYRVLCPSKDSDFFISMAVYYQKT